MKRCCTSYNLSDSVSTERADSLQCQHGCESDVCAYRLCVECQTIRTACCFIGRRRRCLVCALSETKTCSQCKQVLNKSEFYRNHKRCKKCYRPSRPQAKNRLTPELVSKAKSLRELAVPWAVIYRDHFEGVCSYSTLAAWHKKGLI